MAAWLNHIDRPDYGRYNAEPNIVLISSYPRPRRRQRTAEDSKGVCFYTENLAASLGALLGSEKRRLIVLAEKCEDEEPIEEQGHIFVVRLWKRNTVISFLRILWILASQLSHPKLILIQFEFNLFGGIATTAFFPLFVLILRILRKTPCLMIHQVPRELAEIRTHVGLQNKPLQFVMYQALLPTFDRCLLRFTPRVAVHESLQKETLLKLCDRPIFTIPHGCAKIDSRPDRFQARKALRFEKTEIILLCFGFLAHYKGSDWIVREIATHLNAVPNTPLRLVLAGGESPNHRGKPHYKEFVTEIFQAAGKCPKEIQITGFVPDERVPLYFSAADLAIFPYRTQMSASGPLSLALSFGCPFLLSNALSSTLESDDFRSAVRDFELEITDLTFEMSPGQLTSRALALCRDKFRLEAISQMALAVAAKRDWSAVARTYLNFMHGRQTSERRAERGRVTDVGR